MKKKFPLDIAKLLHLDGKSLDIAKLNEEKINGILYETRVKLQKEFPDIFSEDDLYIGGLLEDIGEYAEKEEDAERYAFTWNGKSQSKKLAQQPTLGTLIPCKAESKDWDNTKNIYIEGDNLEVLKLLQKSYFGKIKMIYIDPPYNTGKDFIYPDNYQDNIQNYLELTGQVDAKGRKLSTNPESSGRFHTDWLNMMYPRLLLARNLLTEDGVIFISIDDHEVANLKKICDEVFGELNYVSCFIWKSRQNKDNRNITGVSIDHEYVICYTKNIGTRTFKGTERRTEQYSNPDNDPRGPWTSANMAGLLSEDLRPNCHYDLINPETGVNYGKPKMGWRYDKTTMSKLIDENRIIWPDNPKGRPRKKSFLNEVNESLPGYSSIIGAEIYTRNATKELENIFENRYFDFPKPCSLLKELVEQITNDNDLIIDFFSGSSTMAHAVMQLNAEDGGNRKYIMVQLPEPCEEKSEAYKAGYKDICEIGKERIRRAGEKILNEHPECKGKLDVGFKVFKLAKSNMTHWRFESEVQSNQSELEAKLIQSLGRANNQIVEGAKPIDVIYEWLLKLGMNTLDQRIEKRTVVGKTVYLVNGGALMACMDDDLDEDWAMGLVELHREIFDEDEDESVGWYVLTADYAYDSDQDKINTLQMLMAHGLKKSHFVLV